MCKKGTGNWGKGVVFFIGVFLFVVGCQPENTAAIPAPITPQGERYGIYRLELASGEAELIYGSQDMISGLDLDEMGDRLVFSQYVGDNSEDFSEIFTVEVDGSSPQRLTENDGWDLYPTWSPDGTQIAFLSWRETSLDIYIMDASGENQRPLYASQDHDADVNWGEDKIVFTRQSRIWIMDSDGANAHPVTNPPRAGEWGAANLPFGDYDPRLSPDGSQVVFSRLVDDASPHGNYDIFVVNIDGSNERRLSETGYSQGFANWSHTGDSLVFIVAAIEDAGKYDLYRMRPDGSSAENITPNSFPPEFLVRSAIYAADDNAIYFIGEWWTE